MRKFKHTTFLLFIHFLLFIPLLNGCVNTQSQNSNNNSSSTIATILGSIIAMMLNLDFSAMLWLATLGNAIDNIFYIFIYKNTQSKREVSK